jgi:hypothetical protein
MRLTACHPGVRMGSAESGWASEQMRELATRHAALEARCDLDGVMATLGGDPRYEFWPVGLAMTGRSRVRRYYEHLFASFIPRTRGYDLVAEWVSESSLAQEYEIRLEVEGGVEAHRVIGILFASGHLLGGERIYGSERCLRLMVGDLYDELEAIR